MSLILTDELIYYWYIMGSFPSSEYELEYYKSPRIGFSRECKTSDWEIYDKGKNSEYYFSKKRFTVISRGHYKNDYVKGYLFGRYPIINNLDIIDEKQEENKIERAF